MSNKTISVDEILSEISLLRAKSTNEAPKNDMQQVNDLIEQILTDKKNKQLKEDNIILTDKDKESLQREIKLQTKSITRQYEKAIRGNTRQQKKLHQEDKISLSEMSESLELSTMQKLTEENHTHITQSIKITPIANEQKVKLHMTGELSSNEAKLQKLEALTHTAHIEHIKREMENITSHFGNVKMTGEIGAKTEITPSGYKEYRKNRNKAIDKFVLSDERPAPPKTEINIPVADMELAHTDNITIGKQLEEQESLKKAQSETAQLETATLPRQAELLQDQEEGDDEYHYDYEYTDESEIDDVRDDLLGRRGSLKLSVIGLSVLSVCAFLLALVGMNNGVLSIGTFYTIKPMIYVSSNMVLLLLALIFARHVLFNAINATFTRIPQKDILYSVAMLICFTMNILLLFNFEKLLINGIQLYTPILIISLLFNYISKLSLMKKTVDNFEFLAGENEAYSVAIISDQKIVSDMVKGAIEDEPFLAKNVKSEFMEDFIAHSFKYDKSDEVCTKMAFFVLPIALLLGAATFYFSKDLYYTLSAVSGTIVLATSFVGAIVVSFPLSDTAKITTHFGEMSPCVSTIEEYSSTNALLIDAHDLFPNETVILHGIKTFSGKRIDDAIIDAASVVCKANSVLCDVFLGIIANNKALLKPVDSIVYEDLMGIAAWVDNRRVLIGNRELMVNHSIAVPMQGYEDKYAQLSQDVVYLSVGGELSAAFIIQYKTSKELFDIVNLLDRNLMKAIIKTVDCSLTAEKLAKIFHTEPDVFKLLPSRLHKAFEGETCTKKRFPITLGNNGSLFGYIVSAVATKKLSACVRFGSKLNVVSVVVGIIAFATMLLLGRMWVLTNLALMAYMGIWLLIYWIYQKNVRL